MKKLLVLLLGLVATGVANVRAADQDFTLVNKTGFDIQSVFVSPHGTEEWQEDLLGRALVVNGDFADIKFSRDTKVRVWDLKVHDKDGNGHVWESIDLLGVSKITIGYKAGEAAATYE